MQVGWTPRTTPQPQHDEHYMTPLSHIQWWAQDATPSTGETDQGFEEDNRKNFSPGGFVYKVGSYVEGSVGLCLEFDVISWA